MASTAKVVIRASDKTKKAFASVKKGLKGVKGAVFSTQTGVAALAGAAGLGLLIKSSLRSSDELAKMADKLGITTEKLAGLHHAAELTGVSQNVVNKAIQNMVRTVRDANNGLATYRRSYEELGLSVEELQRLSPDQQFLRISEAIKGVTSNTRRVGIAYDIFGAKATGLLNTLNLGKEGLEAAQIEAEKFGIALNRVDAAKIEQANDAMTRVGAVVKGVGNTITVALAPYIKEIADRFSDASKESNGFKAEVISAFKSTIRGAAKFADILHGLKVVFKGLELIGVAFGAAMISVFEGVLFIVREAMNVIVKDINFVINALNKLPKVNIELVEQFTKNNFGVAISEAAEASREKVVNLRSELHDLAMEVLPSDQVAAFFDEVQAKAQVTAETIASTKPGGADADAGASTEDEGQTLAEEKHAALLERRYIRLQNAFATERELTMTKYDQDVTLLEEAYLNNIIPTQEALDNQLIALEQRKTEKLNAIKYKGLTDGDKFAKAVRTGDLKSSLAFGAKATAGMATQSKKMFAVNKALALANAVVTLPSAVMKSFDNGGGYPWGLIPAGLMLAQGLSQIASIRSAKFGGGGGGSAGVGGGGSAPSTPTAPSNIGGNILPGGLTSAASSPARVININLGDEDEFITKGAVRKLMEKFAEETDDNVVFT